MARVSPSPLLHLAAGAAWLACTACSASTVQGEELWYGADQRLRQVDTSIGGLSFDDEAGWGSTSEQLVLGLEWAEHVDLPVLLQGGVHFSRDKGDELDVFGMPVDVERNLWTFSFGVLLAPWRGSSRFSPFVGGGGTIGRAQVRSDDDAFDAHDWTNGGYLKLGFDLHLYPGGHAGLQYRVFRGSDLQLNGLSVSPDYEALMVVFGTSFGG